MLHGGRGLTLLSVSESQIVLPELVVQKLELLRLSSSGAATTKKPPHDIQMPQQAKSSQMSASINKGKKKIQDAKLIEDLKMGKNLNCNRKRKDGAPYGGGGGCCPLGRHAAALLAVVEGWPTAS